MPVFLVEVDLEDVSMKIRKTLMMALLVVIPFTQAQSEEALANSGLEPLNTSVIGVETDLNSSYCDRKPWLCEKKKSKKK